MVIRTGTRLLVSSCSRLLAMTAIVAALGCGHPDGTLPPEVGPRVPAIVVERAEPLPPLARELLSPRMHRNRPTGGAARRRPVGRPWRGGCRGARDPR